MVLVQQLCSCHSQQEGQRVQVGVAAVVLWAFLLKEMEGDQKHVEGHLFVLNQVFNTGTEHGEKSETRAKEAKQMANLVMHHVYLLAKDHKASEAHAAAAVLRGCCECEAARRITRPR